MRDFSKSLRVRNALSHSEWEKELAKLKEKISRVQDGYNKLIKLRHQSKDEAEIKKYDRNLDELVKQRIELEKQIKELAYK